MARRTEETKTLRINSILGPGTVLDGNFTAKETTRIEGTVNGDVTSEGTVILGEKGKIKGEVKAKNLIVGGTVDGNITVEGKIEITATGSIKGDIVTKSLIIDENAVFQGNCIMNAEIVKTGSVKVEE